MPTRRDILALGAAATAVVLAGRGDAAPVVDSRLETRLFNFGDSVSADRIADCLQQFNDAARAAGVAGMMVGRNLDATPFPTRFEWMTMVERRADPPNSAAAQRYRKADDALTAACRNGVRCAIAGPLPNGYADAAGVAVRHTVLFDFKADAPDAARARNVAAIRRMGTLPMVQAYRVERNAGIDSGPEQMEWQVIGDFASLADFRAYADAPVHLAIRDDFTAHTSRVAFIDVAV